MESHNADEESPTPKKKVTIFGRNIAEIPCFRNSFICGICTGVAGGLITFMFTSKARVSTHSAFASLWVGVFVYWIPCRYKYESTVLMTEEWKKTHKLYLGGRIQGEQISEKDPSAESSEESK